MISLGPQSSGDSAEEQCLELKQRLEKYVQKTDRIEGLLLDDNITPEESRRLEELKKRYSQVVLDLMMKIDFLEDPEG